VAGVAGFDQVGMAWRSRRAGARTDSGHAETVDAGQREGRHAHQGRRFAAAVDVRTEDGVLDTAMPRQPARLGIQIGAHAVAFGGVEHRDVD
jgi:hypothetical protein